MHPTGLRAAAWLATQPPLTPLMACKNRLVRQLERMGQKVILEPVGPGGCRSATNSAPRSLLSSLYLASTLICLKRSEPLKGMKYALRRKAGTVTLPSPGPGRVGPSSTPLWSSWTPLVSVPVGIGALPVPEPAATLASLLHEARIPGEERADP
jgi:hypothetical protein